MKTPYVKITAGFYLKDAPKERLGLRRVNWNFGNRPMPLSELLAALTYRFLEFYISVLPVPVEEINAELAKFCEATASLVVEERKEIQDATQ